MNICKNAKKCGGCQLQNLEYEEQLKLKMSRLNSLLSKYARVKPIVRAEQPEHYRNKVQAAFASRDGRVISGIYQSSSGRIVPCDSCMLENELADKIVVTIRDMCRPFKLKPYDMHTRRGFLRHVAVRYARATGEIMVVLVTAPGEFPSERSFVNELVRRHPEITTVIHNINPTSTALFLGKSSHVLYGDGYITDRLCELEFRISPRSFYQVNPAQTEKLYSTVKVFCNADGTQRIIDAYCGTGTIGLSLADTAHEVIGIEVNSDAVSDAKSNARLNGIKNARFIAADAADAMARLAARGEGADIVVTDPPRAGCSMKFLKSLLALAPKRIVYVSCEPETLARDLHTLTRDYRVKTIVPFDMFPYTRHVECACLLTRKQL